MLPEQDVDVPKISLDRITPRFCGPASSAEGGIVGGSADCLVFLLAPAALEGEGEGSGEGGREDAGASTRRSATTCRSLRQSGRMAVLDQERSLAILVALVQRDSGGSCSTCCVKIHFTVFNGRCLQATTWRTARVWCDHGGAAFFWLHRYLRAHPCGLDCGLPSLSLQGRGFLRRLGSVWARIVVLVVLLTCCAEMDSENVSHCFQGSRGTLLVLRLSPMVQLPRAPSVHACTPCGRTSYFILIVSMDGRASSGDGVSNVWQQMSNLSFGARSRAHELLGLEVAAPGQGVHEL